MWRRNSQRNKRSKKVRILKNEKRITYVQNFNTLTDYFNTDFHEDSGNDAADILLPQMNEDRLFDAINSAVDDAPFSAMTGSSEHNG